MAADTFTGNVLCWHPECQWETPDGVSGIEARYTDEQGRPVCWDHYTEPVKEEDNGSSDLQQ